MHIPKQTTKKQIHPPFSFQLILKPAPPHRVLGFVLKYTGQNVLFSNRFFGEQPMHPMPASSRFFLTCLSKNTRSHSRSVVWRWGTRCSVVFLLVPRFQLCWLGRSVQLPLHFLSKWGGLKLKSHFRLVERADMGGLRKVEKS